MFYKVIIVSILILFIHGCGNSSESRRKDREPELTQAESAALEVLDVHLEARNNLDPDQISAVNNYPNVRLTNEQVQVFETFEIYRNVEDLITMARLRDSDWDHSEWDEVKIIQSSDNKVHIAVIYSRYNTEGERMLQGHQVYFITDQEDHWGIKVRSAMPGVDLLNDPGSSKEAEDAALEVLDDYMQARNDRDSTRIAALHHYPHLLLDGVEQTIFVTPDDYISYEENTVIHALDYAEWDHSELENFEVIQSSPNKVHLAYKCEHMNVVSECTDVEEGLWAITKVDDRWGILGRSLF